MLDPSTPPARSAFSAETAPILFAEELHAPGAATLSVRNGKDEALVAIIAERYGITLPSGPACAVGDGLTALGVGPGVWLLVKEGGSTAFAAELAGAVQSAASVADQSSGYAFLRLSGAAAPDILQKGPFIDLEPSVFSPGSAAVTLAAHLGLIIWRPGPGPVYGVAVFRSYAQSFLHWLETVAGVSGARLNLTTAER